MGKRSDFARVERDFYETPLAAVEPLARHLPAQMTYCEPCAGAGALIRHIDALQHEEEGLSWRCKAAYDIEPLAEGIHERNALELTENDLQGADIIITNPPWDRKLLHPMIVRFATLRPTWLLFDADWLHTQQSRPLLPYLREIVSIGRVKWIPGSKNTGKDNCCWYLFDAPAHEPIIFHGRS